MDKETLLKTHWMIFSRSRGETTVLDAAPAHPPATKYVLSWDWRIGCLRSGGFSCGTGIGIDLDDDDDETVSLEHLSQRP